MTKFSPIKTAVIPVSGYGTRFLPLTKAFPKEMLPVVDKPVVHLIVEQLVKSGIKNIVFVNKPHKKLIEDYFSPPEIELRKRVAGNKHLQMTLKDLERLTRLANIRFVLDRGPGGTASPLYSVRRLVGNEPFIYTLGDDLIVAHPSEFDQLAEAFSAYGTSLLSCIRAKKESDYDSYGFIGGDKIAKRVIQASSVISRPGRNRAPSDMAAVSSYLFTPDVFGYLKKVLKGKPSNREFSLHDALDLMMKDKKILGVEIKNGQFFDFGNKLEYLKAIVRHGIENKEVGKEFSLWLRLFIGKSKQLR